MGGMAEAGGVSTVATGEVGAAWSGAERARSWSVGRKGDGGSAKANALDVVGMGGFGGISPEGDWALAAGERRPPSSSRVSNGTRAGDEPVVFIA